MRHKIKWADASQSRVIDIKTADGKEALCSDHQNCVIAKAIKRQLGATWVDVGARTVLIQPNAGQRIFRYKLKAKAQEQVKFFDTAGQFAPFFVELSAPPRSQTLEAGRQYSESYLKRKKYYLNPKRQQKRRSLATR